MFKIYVLLLLWGSIWAAFTPLLGQQYQYHTFGGTRVLSSHSLDAQRRGELGVLVSTRSPNLSGQNALREDPLKFANRVGIVYGLADWLGVQFGATNLQHTLDGSLKIRMIRQGLEGGAPISMTYVAGMALATRPGSDSLNGKLFTDQLYYTHQLILGSRVSDRFSFQLMPSLLHRNYVSDVTAKNDVFAFGAAARYRLSRNVAVTMEYYRILPGQLSSDQRDRISAGLAMTRGKYLVQLLISNTQGMSERFVLGEPTQHSAPGPIFVGINLSRTVKFGKKWH